MSGKARPGLFVNTLTQVTFSDHSSGYGKDNGLVECVAYGLLILISDTELRLLTWKSDNDPYHEESEILSIARGAVTGIFQATEIKDVS
jgi:hypothetical protein